MLPSSVSPPAPGPLCSGTEATVSRRGPGMYYRLTPPSLRAEVASAQSSDEFAEPTHPVAALGHYPASGGVMGLARSLFPGLLVEGHRLPRTPSPVGDVSSLPPLLINKEMLNAILSEHGRRPALGLIVVGRLSSQAFYYGRGNLDGSVIQALRGGSPPANARDIAGIWVSVATSPGETVHEYPAGISPASLDWVVLAKDARTYQVTDLHRGWYTLTPGTRGRTVNARAGDLRLSADSLKNTWIPIFTRSPDAMSAGRN